MKVMHYQENTIGNDYACGDVHGCYDKLQESLDEIGFDTTKDRLFIVGDLVDRGPQSEDTLDWLAKPWFISVRGNHEQMAIDYCNGLSDDYYEHNGGKWIMSMPKSHARLYADIFSDLPIAIDIQVGDKLYGIVHADVPVDDWIDLDPFLNGEHGIAYENCCLWSRDRFNYKDDSIVKNVEKVYVGHTPVKQVTTLGNVVYCDTGAVFGGKITILKIY